MSFHLRAVVGSGSADFSTAYAALHAEFGARGELERREVLAQWLDEPKPAVTQGLERSYHLLVATDEHGDFAGARDCHVIVDRKNARIVVYLAHVLVLPAFRRRGLARLFRTYPLELAARTRDAAELDVSRTQTLLAAEMEPFDAADPASATRLVAYARDGFAAIDYASLPYAQPDFRLLRSAEELQTAVPLPLLPIVRWAGHEGAASLPKPLARSFVAHLHAVFATHVHPHQLEALGRRTLGGLDASPLIEVPLLPLPQSFDDHASFAPLTRQRVLDCWERTS